MYILLCLLFCVDAGKVEAASLNAKTITMVEGEKTTLKVKGAKGKVVWSSDNKKVATVNKGVVTAKKAGTTYIRAKVSGKIYRCKVRVQAVKISSISARSEDKGDLITTVSASKAQLSFKLNTTAKKVLVYVCNSDGKKIKTYSIGKVTSGKIKTISWNLTNSKNKKVSAGEYYFLIKVYNKEAKSGLVTVYDKNDFAGGTGSKTNPYQVKNLEQLKAVVRHNNRYFVQAANIDANYASLPPLYSRDNPFQGNYNGKNYAIFNLNSIFETSEIFDVYSGGIAVEKDI